MQRLARCSGQAKLGYGARPTEDDSVARPVAYPEESAGTADGGDHEEGLAATAVPDGDTALGAVSEPSDDDADDLYHWTGSSDEWPGIFAAALGLANPVPRSAETSKPTAVTLFAGTDAPMLALDMLATGVYRHTLSCDSSSASRDFINANFKPEHQFTHVEQNSLPFAECCICNKSCDAFHKKINFLMAGFPCTPFSGMSPRRWKDGYDPLGHPDAAAFIALRRFLGNTDHDSEPDAALLENVGSVLHQSRNQEPTAAELIMSGILQKPGKKEFKYGLKFLKPFRVKMFGPLAGTTVGISFERPRCFWLLLRRSRYSEANLQAWFDNACYLASRAIRPKPTTCHFADQRASHNADSSCDSGSDSGLAETAGPLPKKRRVAMEQTAAAFRKAHGLPKFGSADGHPYSTTAPDDIRRRLSPRELDVLDSAFLYLQKFADGVPDNLAVDVSQSPSRMPWRTGGHLPSPCKRSLIWHKGRVLDPATMFSLMGWPRDSLRLPKLKNSQLRALIGNMCCPPQAGLLIASFLAVHPEFKIPDKD